MMQVAIRRLHSNQRSCSNAVLKRILPKLANKLGQRVVAGAKEDRAAVQAGWRTGAKAQLRGHLEVATTLENYASAYRAKDIRGKHALLGLPGRTGQRAWPRGRRVGQWSELTIDTDSWPNEYKNPGAYTARTPAALQCCPILRFICSAHPAPQRSGT